MVVNRRPSCSNFELKKSFYVVKCHQNRVVLTLYNVFKLKLRKNMHNPVIVTPKNNLPYFFYKKIKFLHFGRNLEFPTPPTTIRDHCALCKGKKTFDHHDN